MLQVQPAHAALSCTTLPPSPRSADYGNIRRKTSGYHRRHERHRPRYGKAAESTAGARVLVTGRTQALLDAAKAELGASAVVVSSDAASLADVDALAERAKSEFGALDLAFLNAGVTSAAPFEGMTEQAYDELFAINVKGAYFTAQRLAPLMVRGKRDRVPTVPPLRTSKAFRW